MATDTSERSPERLICTALAGWHPCDPPADGTVADPPADYSRLRPPIWSAFATRRMQSAKPLLHTRGTHGVVSSPKATGATPPPQRRYERPRRRQHDRAGQSPTYAARYAIDRQPLQPTPGISSRTTARSPPGARTATSAPCVPSP